MNSRQLHGVIFAAIITAFLVTLLVSAVVLAQETPTDGPEGPDEHDELAIGDTVPEDETRAAGPPPPADFGIDRAKSGDTSATLAWTPFPPVIVDRYRVDYKTSRSTAWTLGGYRAGPDAPPLNELTLTISSLTCDPETTYNFRISSRDPVTFRYGEPSSTVSHTLDCEPDLQDPPPPAGLEVTSTTRTSISLNWDSESGISKYRVRYGSNSPETTSSSYTASPLACGTSYTFNISAYGDGSTYQAVWGDDSSITHSTDTCQLPDPPAPAGLEVTSTTRTSISLNWDSESGISKYRVRYGSNSPETTSSSYTASPLACGTSYTFNISAYGDGSTYQAVWGDDSSITHSTDTCQLPDPPAPAGLEVTSTTRTSISLNWDSESGISKYRVRYGSNSPETTSSSYTASPLACGTSYTFNISAYGDGSTYQAVWGDDSSITHSTDTCQLPDPPAPAGLEVTSTTRTSISLNWDSESGISKYRVRYGSNSPETTSSSYTASPLACGTSYTFNISAYGDGSTYQAV